ncbi:MAG: hypothetical protein V3S83_12540 [Gemmatimonadota bacterium]
MTTPSEDNKQIALIFGGLIAIIMTLVLFAGGMNAFNKTVQDQTIVEVQRLEVERARAWPDGIARSVEHITRIWREQ